MRTAPAIGKTDDNDLFHVGSGVLQFWTLDRTAQSVRRALATVAVKAKAQAIIKFRISPPSKWLPEPVPAVPLLLVMERGGNAIQMGGQSPRLCALGHITAADPSLVFRCSISGGINPAADSFTPSAPALPPKFCLSCRSLNGPPSL